MKINYLLSAMVMVALLGISACGDDPPPPKTGISFEAESFLTLESDGTLTSFHPDLINGGAGREFVVKILLDRALSETTVLQYTVSGTATRTNPAGSAVNDYAIKDGLNTIVGTDKITIEKGATEANFIITVFEDFSFEVDDDDSPIETAIIKFTSVVSGNAELGLADTYTLSIEEDDALILHQWFVDGTDGFGDVDMDLFVTLDGDLINSSTYDNNSGTRTLPYEGLFIPAGFPNGTYGVSYTYYSGTSDDVDVVSLMWGRLNGQVYPYFTATAGSVLVFEANYGLNNINRWDDEVEGTDPQVVQTMVKNGVAYTNISQITVPASGSRVAGAGFTFDRKTIRKISDLKLRMIDLPEGVRKK
ncbi:MAG: hypothetical protein KIT62_14655 [Cyclobacteriaceae bacterium]|nr:hypothetical protein [Cyclobacteriaceae bacterium]